MKKAGAYKAAGLFLYVFNSFLLSASIVRDLFIFAMPRVILSMPRGNVTRLRCLLGGDSVDRLCKTRDSASSIVTVQDVLGDGFIK